jgi:hypothetical protein
MLQRLHGRPDHSMKALFVDGHLYRNVRQSTINIAVEALGRLSRIIFAIGPHWGQGATNLSKVTDNSLEEKLKRSAYPPYYTHEAAYQR